MMKVLRDVSEANRALTQQPRVVEQSEAPERVSAISGLEFKQNLPVIKDPILIWIGTYVSFNPSWTAMRWVEEGESIPLIS